eukprot:957909-Pyramimonas_sp.AAC.1
MPAPTTRRGARNALEVAVIGSWLDTIQRFIHLNMFMIPLEHAYDPLEHAYDPLEHAYDPLEHAYDPLEHAYDPLEHAYDPL